MNNIYFVHNISLFMVKEANGSERVSNINPEKDILMLFMNLLNKVKLIYLLCYKLNIINMIY